MLLLIMPASRPVCVDVHWANTARQVNICVDVHWAKTARQVNKRHHHMAAATGRVDPCGPPPSLACVSLALVLCAASHSIPPPPPPPVQACHVALFKWSRRLCLVFVVVGVHFAFPSGVRCSVHHHQARPASSRLLFFGLALWHH